MSGNDAAYLLSRHNELLGLDEDDHLQYLKLVTGIKFAGIINIGPSAGFRAVEHFPTINEGIDYVNSLTGDETPADDTRYVFSWHAGIYTDKKPWLPDFCWLHGVSPIEQFLIGDGNGDFLISIGIGGIINAGLAPVGVDYDTGIYFRNSGSVFSQDESNYPGPGIVGTLLVTPSGHAQETIMFAGEADAAACAAEINTQGVNIEAYDIWGRLEIRSKIANENISIDKTGTANAGLGFSTTENTDNPTSLIENRKADNIAIRTTFGKDMTTGIQVDDRFGFTFLNSVNITQGAGSTLIDVTPGASLFMITPSLVSINGTCLNMGDGSYCEIDGGKAIGGDPSLTLHDNATLKARNFTYSRRSASGTIIPSGSRINFEFILEGKITPGTGLNGRKRIPYDCHIENISVVRGDAGIGGQTIIDVNKHLVGAAPTTLYTNQANRPTINQTDGDDFGIAAILPDDRDLDEGQILTVDVDQAETGLPKDLNIMIIATVK